MSENPNKDNQPAKDGKDQEPKEVHVKVDAEQIKQMAEELAKEKADAKAAREQAAKAEADKKASDEAKKLSDEAAKKATEEADDAKGKLGLIAEKALEKKRAEVTEKANQLFQNDPERVKEVVAKLKDPEGVQAMEYTLNVLDQTLKKGEEARNKLVSEEKAKLEAKAKADAEAAAAIAAGGKPAPAGSAPLNDKQLGQAETGDLMKMKFDSHEAMVRYLKELEHGSDPELAAKAKVVLNKFFENWAQLVKQGYDSMKGESAKQVIPSFKELTLSKRAQEELKRRQEGKTPERVISQQVIDYGEEKN